MAASWGPSRPCTASSPLPFRCALSSCDVHGRNHLLSTKTFGEQGQRFSLNSMTLLLLPTRIMILILLLTSHQDADDTAMR